MPGHSWPRLRAPITPFFSPFCKQWRATRVGHLFLFCLTIGGILSAFGHLSLNRPRPFRRQFFSSADSAIGAASHRRIAIGTSELRELARIFRAFQRPERCARFPPVKCSNEEVPSASQFPLERNSFPHAMLGAVLLQSWSYPPLDFFCRKMNDFTRNGNVSRPLQVR